MKKLILFLLTALLFISCNADILMTNGEISKPADRSGATAVEDDTVPFSTAAPTGVNATKSYYKDCISVRWNEVTGADYYTLEKCVKDTPASPSSSDRWTTIGETIITNSYQDRSALEVEKYYSYRVTAHTLTGESGEVSAVSTGTILSSPESIEASKGTSEDAIIVSWTQMPYVDQYEIYKSTISSITGLRSELVATVNADDGNAVKNYSYMIDSKEKGVELYFAIVGVGPTGSRADISFSRSGYTLVPGAPGKPDVKAEKGESLDSVNVHFKVSGDASGVTYVIRKSYKGSAEQVVFTSEHASGEADPLASLTTDSEGYYIYQDNAVSPNVEYTYTVTARNDIGISAAGTATGYLLSPLKSLSLVPSSADSHFGYDITYTLPVGAGDNDRTAEYTYTVTKTLKDGTSDTEEYSETEFALFETFMSVEKNPTREGEKKEIRKIEISVSNGTTSTAAAVSNVIENIPEPVDSITASKFTKPLSGESANSRGVYPVHVTWTTASTSGQTVTRKGSDGSVKQIKANGSLVDTDTSPLVVYDYYIDTSDELGRSIGEIKHTGDAYGAVTPEVMIAIFESAGLKPWERQSYVPETYRSYWKKSKISTLVNYGNASDLSTQMKALDSAEDTDHYRNGKITYSASMEGVGGQIYFTYDNFGESDRFYIKGNYEMHVNASGTGTCKSTTDGFQILGMYSGKISLEKMSVTNKAFSGIYVLTINYRDGSSVYEVAAK